MFIGTDSENAKRSNMFIGTYPNGQQAQLETIKYEKNGILYILCMYVCIYSPIMNPLRMSRGSNFFLNYESLKDE
jgi:hypothetical protein